MNSTFGADDQQPAQNTASFPLDSSPQQGNVRSGFTPIAATDVSTKFSFDAPMTTATTGFSFFGTPTTTVNTNFSFGTPTVSVSTSSSIGAPVTTVNTSSSIGAPVTTATTGFYFGTPTASVSTRSSIGTPVTTVTTGSSYGSSLSLATSSATTAVPTSTTNVTTTSKTTTKSSTVSVLNKSATSTELAEDLTSPDSLSLPGSRIKPDQFQSFFDGLLKRQSMNVAAPSAIATGGEERNAITILWRIENIGCFEEGFHRNVFCSPFFDIHILNEGTYQLSFIVRDESEGVRIQDLWFYAMDAFSFQVDCEFLLLSSDGSPLAHRIERKIKEGTKTIYMTDSPVVKKIKSKNQASSLHDILTVRCRIWKSNGNFPNAEFITACSRIKVLENCFLRPIGGFDSNDVPQTYKLPVNFSFLDVYFEHQLRFSVDYSLEGRSLQDSGLVIKVTAIAISETCLLKLKVFILHEQETIKLLDAENTFDSEMSQIWVVPKCVLRERLPKNICNYIRGNGPNLLFHWKAVCKCVTRFIEKRHISTSNLEQDIARATSTIAYSSHQNGDALDSFQRKILSLSVLGEELQSLYCEQTMTDFKLCSGGVSIPVHKVFLSARSPVFKAMFSSDMTESGSDSLDIPDLDSHTLNRLLTFMYTASLEPDLQWESAAKLYYAADKYQVQSLKEQCSAILQCGTSASNASDILSLADRHQDQELTSFVHDFILSRFDEVMRSKEWKKFLDDDSELVGKSMHELYLKKIERKEN